MAKFKPNMRNILLQPEVVNMVSDMIALRHPATAIRKTLDDAYGNRFTDRQFADLMKTAQALLVLNSKKAKDQAFAESVGFYEFMIRSDVDPRFKIAAQTRLDALFGLDATRIQTGLDPETIADKLRQVAKAMDTATRVEDLDEDPE